MTKIPSALLYSSLTQYSLKLISLVSIIVVARLLTPEEIGVFIIASSLLIVLNELKGAGTGAYLIRKEHLENRDIQSSLGLTILICWLIGASLLTFSQFIEDFFSVKDIGNLINILSISFFTCPLPSVIRGLLTRSYEFKKIFLLSFFASSISLVISITLILNGYSYYSLAYANVASALIELFISIYLRPRHFKYLPTFSGLKEIFSIGAYITANNLIRRLNTTAPDLILGKIGTASSVAIFSRGTGLLDFILSSLIQGVNPVALPYLSESKRNKTPLATPYLKAANLLGAVTIPAMLVIGYLSEPLILMTFGDQWREAIPIAQIMCYWGAIRSIHALSPSLLIAAHYEKEMLIKDTLLLITLFISIYFSYQYSLAYMAIAITACSLFDHALTSYLIGRVTGSSFLKMFNALFYNFPVGLICLSTCILIDNFLMQYFDFSIYINIATILVFVLIVWIYSIKLLKHPIYAETLKLIHKR